MDRIPILRLGRALPVTLQVDLADHVEMASHDNLSRRIARTGATGVPIDISALEIVDSVVGRTLAGISGIAAALDATTVVVA